MEEPFTEAIVVQRTILPVTEEGQVTGPQPIVRCSLHNLNLPLPILSGWVSIVYPKNELTSQENHLPNGWDVAGDSETRLLTMGLGDFGTWGLFLVPVNLRKHWLHQNPGHRAQSWHKATKLHCMDHLLDLFLPLEL